jgi:hypothetical protein
MLGFGKKKPVQQAQLMVKGDISPEEKQALKELYYNSSEAYSRTFIPLTLINRERVVYHLRKAKEGLDKLVKVI